MSRVLVKYHSNWNDEIDVEGFAIMTIDQYTTWLISFCRADSTKYYWYFCKTKFISEWNVFDDFTATCISDAEAQALTDSLGLYLDWEYPTYGNFPTFTMKNY
jgi:hypothetical protein